MDSVARALFQSTLPAWGETNFNGHSGHAMPFQSTLPAWGETRSRSAALSAWIFQSTLPAWGETLSVKCCIQYTKFQSTLPAWGETANAHNFSKRKTGASAQHCIFSPAKRFFLLTKKLFRKKKQTVFSVRTVQENRGSSRIAPTIEELDHQNPFGVIRSLCAYMLYLRFVTISEIVEAKAVLSRVD